MLVEVNPDDRDPPTAKVVALDAKVTPRRETACFRHPDKRPILRDGRRRGPAGADGQGSAGLTYVKLDGNVGNPRATAPGLVDVDARRRRPGRAASRPTFPRRPAAASKAEAITQGRSRSSSPTPRSPPCCFKHLRRQSRRCDEVRARPDRGVRPDRADRAVRGAARRHQRQGGPGAAGPRPTCRTCTPSRRCSGRPKRVVELAGDAGGGEPAGETVAARAAGHRNRARPAARRPRGGRRVMAILVDESHEALRSPASPGARGTFPRDEQQALRHPGRVGRDARQGRPGRSRGGPGVQHVPRRGQPRPARNTAMIFVPPRFAADSILEAEGRRGSPWSSRSTEGHPPPTTSWRVYNQPARQPETAA